MFYRYETHLHTSEASRCGESTGAEMARACKKAGYTGLVVTDHFVNANTTVPADLPWPQRIDLFLLGYEQARAEGERIGLDVFLGWEYLNRPFGEDYLTYGLDRSFLLAHPEIESMPFAAYCRLVHDHDGLIIQAHPYREASYIPGPARPKVRLVDGLEVNNESAGHPEQFNHKTWDLARRNPHLVRTSGTDIHQAESAGLAGIAFAERIGSIRQMVREMKAGHHHLIIDRLIADLEGNTILEEPECLS